VSSDVSEVKEKNWFEIKEETINVEADFHTFLLQIDDEVSQKTSMQMWFTDEKSVFLRQINSFPCKMTCLALFCICLVNWIHTQCFILPFVDSERRLWRILLVLVSRDSELLSQDMNIFGALLSPMFPVS
jgi:hypothetical protein